MNNTKRSDKIIPNRGSTRLCSVVLPVWMLFFMPSVWLIALPINLVINSVVLLITLATLAENRGEAGYKPWGDWLRAIVPVWIFGFISDLVAAGFLLFWGMGPTLLMGDLTTFGAWWGPNVAEPITENPFGSIFSVLFVLLSIGLGGLLKYFLNKNMSLRLTKSLDVPEIKRAALALAVITAPWTMLLPSEWFW